MNLPEAVEKSSASQTPSTRLDLPDGLLRACKFVLLLAAAVGVAAGLAQLWPNWLSDKGVDHPAGVLIAMAADLAHGVFYRPLFGPDGYGGTRYFPLYFVLHSILIKLGVPILFAAYLLSGAAIAALLVAVFLLLRSRGATLWLAGACTAALFTLISIKYAVISPHADGLATALTMWGVLCVVGPIRGRQDICASSILFSLAWAAKPTTCFGLLMAVVWLVRLGLGKKAIRLLTATLVGYLVVLAAMLIASGGRVFGIFRSCSSGGATWSRFLEGFVFLQWDAVHKDLGVFLLVVFSLGILLSELMNSPAESLKDWCVLLFALTLVFTIAIFGSPGTNLNHLLDLGVASILFLGCRAIRMQEPRGRLALVALTVATLIPAGRSALALVPPHSNPEDRVQTRQSLRQFAASVSSDKPILSENPIIPVLVGQRPYVLDPWMLKLLRTRIPDFDKAFLKRIETKYFGVVVLLYDPGSDYGQAWYENQHFGPGFTQTLMRNYQLLRVADTQFIYVPITN